MIFCRTEERRFVVAQLHSIVECDDYARILLEGYIILPRRESTLKSFVLCKLEDCAKVLFRRRAMTSQWFRQPYPFLFTGTDADLRKLSLNHAKQLLRKYGCHDDQIKKLTRWEIVDLVRTLGTQQARSGAEEAMSKFARGNRYSAAEQQEKYRDDCQRLFELQNRVLSSGEILSTDEESSEEEEDSDLEELGRNLDSFIQSKKSSKELLFEREEEERKELKKLLNQEEAQNIIQQKKKRGKVGKKKNAAVEEPVDEGIAQPVRKLKIVRTFRDADGRDFDRTEYVSRAPLIEAYVRIRTTTDSEFIRQFAAHDSERKEAVRKEKRRIQVSLLCCVVVEAPSASVILGNERT